MIGYIIIVVIALAAGLLYWRLSKNYEISEKLTIELNEKAKTKELIKSRLPVKAFGIETLLALPSSRTVYFFDQGILIFDGKGETEQIATWLYFNQADKKYFKNCQSRGRILAAIEKQEKTIYEVYLNTNQFPFFIGKQLITFEISHSNES